MISYIAIAMRAFAAGSARLRRIAFLIAPLVLVACGGGGGGGGTGGGGGGGGGAAPPPPSEFPATISLTRAENNSLDAWEAPKFQFYAPTTELPTGVQLTGADGQFFTVALEASNPPSATGFREITVKLQPQVAFNFENPSDANKDNIYDFQLSGTYGGATLTSQVKVTITDVADAAEATARYIFGELPGQEFGLQLSLIPDISGDDKSELGVGIQSGVGAATGYVVTSEFFNGLQNLATNIGAQGNIGTRFLDRSLTGAFEFNRLSASVTNGGVSLLLSDVGALKMFLVQALSPDEYPALHGDIEPVAASNKITYTPGGPMEGRVIGDVNGDGIADILTRPLSQLGLGQDRVFAVIYGRRPLSDADRNRNAFSDIGFAYTLPPPSGGGGSEPVNVRLEATLVSDVDGDGFRDLIIILPDYGFDRDADNRGALWLVKGAALRTSGIFFLDNLAPSQGFKFTGRSITGVTEAGDFDADGYRTLVFSSASGDYAIDANDFGALDPSTLPAPSSSSPLFGPRSFRIDGGAWQNVFAGDVDGDGLDDIVGSPQGAVAPTPQGSILNVLRGSRIKKAMEDSAFNADGGSDLFKVGVTAPVGYVGNMKAGAPVSLGASGVIAVPIAPVDLTSGQDSDKAGRIIFVKRADILAAIAKSLPGLDLISR